MSGWRGARGHGPAPWAPWGLPTRLAPGSRCWALMAETHAAHRQTLRKRLVPQPPKSDLLCLPGHGRWATQGILLPEHPAVWAPFSVSQATHPPDTHRHRVPRVPLLPEAWRRSHGQHAPEDSTPRRPIDLLVLEACLRADEPFDCPQTPPQEAGNSATAGSTCPAASPGTLSSEPPTGLLCSEPTPPRPAPPQSSGQGPGAKPPPDSTLHRPERRPTSTPGPGAGRGGLGFSG